MKEVVVTAGANGALGCFTSAFMNHGDNMVMFEPCYPIYPEHASIAGGTVKSVPLHLRNNEWTFEPEQLRAAFDKNTKVFMFNTPHNPTGKMFSLKEIEQISSILDDYPEVTVFSDEVYDYLNFNGKKHIPFASVGDNWYRTVSIYSGGKLFNATGWKIGWAVAPHPLLNLGGIIHNTKTDCQNTPGQVAFSRGLDIAFEPGYEGQSGVSYAQDTSNYYEANKDYLMKELSSINLPWRPIESDGGFFLLADISDCVDIIPDKYKNTIQYEHPDDPNPVQKYELYMPGSGRIPYDLAFCRWMAVEKGIGMLPLSFFYELGSENTTDNIVRLALCKTKESTAECVEKLKLSL